MLQSQTKIVGALPPNAVFFLPLACLLVQSTQQILQTNFGGVRRQQSVPKILAETVFMQKF